MTFNLQLESMFRFERSGPVYYVVQVQRMNSTRSGEMNDDRICTRINLRFKDFLQFRNQLVETGATNIPEIGPTRKWYNFLFSTSTNQDPKKIRQRYVDLETFLRELTANNNAIYQFESVRPIFEQTFRLAPEFQEEFVSLAQLPSLDAHMIETMVRHQRDERRQQQEID